MVADVNATPVSTSVPTGLVDVNGTVFFAQDDGVHGTELWKSDGTPGGTTMVKDILHGPAGSSPTGLANINGTLYFAANDGTHGSEVWESDGTAAGTVLVADTLPGLSSSSPYGFSAIGPKGYFFARDPGSTPSYSIWTIDGATVTKIKTVSDANADTPQNPVVMGGSLYFIDGSNSGRSALWRSDGTATNTGSILGPLGTASNLTVAGNRLFFLNGKTQLWTSDGTTAGTVMVAQIGTGADAAHSIGNLTAVGNNLFFTANDGTTGNELWWSDGVTYGQVKDIYAGSSSSSPSSLAAFAGKLYFAAQDFANGRELWTSDGTPGGTSVVKDIWPGINFSSPVNIQAIGNRFYFGAAGSATTNGLWVSDGTAGGTAFVKSLGGSLNNKPGPFVASGGAVYFPANDGTSGVELWRRRRHGGQHRAHEERLSGDCRRDAALH